jgi:hypothetical protein
MECDYRRNNTGSVISAAPELANKFCCAIGYQVIMNADASADRVLLIFGTRLT